MNEHCSECGCLIHNGEAYFEINSSVICETCTDNLYRRIMDYDYRYTKEDYLTEKYERQKCDA